MAKSKYILTEEAIQARLKAGWGQGYGKDYKPFLTVRDVSSHGRSHRVRGYVTGRVHHLLSDIEYNHLLRLDMSPGVVDIREQFALDRDVTRRIAKQLGYRHPRQPGAGCDMVMTTDLVVTIQCPGYQVFKAYAVKPASELTKKRVAQKLEIEGAYWKSQGIVFDTLTDKDIPFHLRMSLQWMRAAREIRAADDATRRDVRAGIPRLAAAIAANTKNSQPLSHLCSALDDAATMEAGTHLLVARHLLANRVLVANLSREKIWDTPVSEIRLNIRASA